MIQAREFTSEAEMRAARAAVHNRVFPSKPTTALRVTIVKPAKAPRKQPLETPPEAVSTPIEMPFLTDFMLNFMTAGTSASGLRFMDSLHAGYSNRRLVRSVSAIEAEILARHPDFTPKVMRSARRDAAIVKVRHEIWYRIHIERPDVSYPTIGRLYKRDHTTVLHGVRMHKKRNGIGGVHP